MERHFQMMNLFFLIKKKKKKKKDFPLGPQLSERRVIPVYTPRVYLILHSRCAHCTASPQHGLGQHTARGK